MSEMVNAMYGLPREHWRTIYRILERQEELQWVKLFGSRARGDYRCTSDVDLAFAGAAGVRERLLGAFERSGLPYTFDVIDYGRQANERLQRTVDIEGKLIFTAEMGKRRMTKVQIHLKWEDYHRALHRLQRVLEMESDVDGIYLDATIQRFEFCFELAWKLMKAVLSYDGIEVSSPRGSIREAWKLGIIGDAEMWLDMLERRNLSAHTYSEVTAEEIYQAIRETYIELLLRLDAYAETLPS